MNPTLLISKMGMFIPHFALFTRLLSRELRENVWQFSAKDCAGGCGDHCMISPFFSGKLCWHFSESSPAVHLCWTPAGFPKQPSNLIKTAFHYTPWASPSFVSSAFFFISDKLQLQITFQTFKMTGKVCPCLGPWRPHVLVRLSALYWCCPRSPSVGISFSFMGGSPVSRLTVRFPETSVLSFMHASCIQHSLLLQLAQSTACKSAWSAWCWDLSGYASSTLILFWDGAEYSEHLQS